MLAEVIRPGTPSRALIATRSSGSSRLVGT
jgi:hypothetical protein